MTIRRASDSTTQSIGFVGEEIDESAIETFCSGTTCTIQVWRDQSGNGNDAEQTNTANQPTIYTGGQIVKQGGRVAVYSDDSTTYQSLTGSISGIGTTFTHFAAIQPASIKVGRVAVYRINSTIDLYDNGRIYEANGVADTAVNPAFTADNFYIHALERKSNEVVFYGNGVQIGQESGAAPSNTYSSFRFLSSGNSTGNTYNGYVSELLFYGSLKSTSDRTDIEGNISAYFQSAKLLDEQFGSGAEAAYSVRQLKRDNTDCMVIRRASDSTTTTIGFDSEGNIDEAAITTFCTGTTCTVYQWLDQSGNGNTATAPSTGEEPTIYTGGALVKENGKLALDFDGGKVLTESIDWAPRSTFLLTKTNGAGGPQQNILRKGSSPSDRFIYRFNQAGSQYLSLDAGFSNLTYSSSIETKYLFNHTLNGGTKTLQVNGVLTGTTSGTLGTLTTDTLYIGKYSCLLYTSPSPRD
jgi:hypothetical protein